jgi:hypothetical protein
MVAVQPKEIPMTKSKSKPKLASRANDRKTKTRNTVTRTTAHKASSSSPIQNGRFISDRDQRRSRLHAAKANRLSSLQCCECQTAPHTLCLLRTRRERPRSRRTAEKCDELAPLHVPSERTTPCAIPLA